MGYYLLECYNTHVLFNFIDRVKDLFKYKQSKFAYQNHYNNKSKLNKRTPKSASNKKLLYLTYAASAGLILTISGVVIVFIVLAVFSRQLPNPNTLLERNAELSTKLYDRNGVPIFELFGEKNREIVAFDQVSPNIIHATMAAEDSNFYQHQGFDFLGMVRATRNIILGKGLQSGSTITQQVVKNTLLTQERTITRKIKELILSLQLENKYTKDQIFQMYLNETPYGGQNYGILTASKAYFNKEPKDLTVAEAAFIAGLPQSPTRYSPYSSDPSIGLERQKYVLYLMKERGWLDSNKQRHFLSSEEYEKALMQELNFIPARTSFEAPHFVFYVKEVLADRFGDEVVEQGGLQVTTTLDLELQADAQEIVKSVVDDSSGLNIYNGSLVALDSKTGQILAMVGSKDYFGESFPEGCTSGITGEGSCLFEPNLNVSIAKRQPGSSIKPITYVTMLEQGYTASYPFLDVPTTFKNADGGTKDYNPVNYDGQFRGVMTLRRSLGNSLNIPAVKALAITGVDEMIDTAEKLGITTLQDRSRFGLALTLGGGETKLVEMTGAFATFANKGKHNAPIGILEVKDSHGNTLYSWKESGGTQAISEESAFLIADILSDDGARSAAFGANSLLNIPNHKVAVKTGTTDDKRDNYAMGFTPSITVGVWVGNNNNDAMNPNVSSGISGATPIYRRFMISYLADKTPEKFEVPKNVKKVEIDSFTGALPYKDTSNRTEWFANGTEPTAPSPWYQSLEICKIDKKLASSACKDAGETEIKTFINITAELLEWQNDVDKWVAENYSGDSKYFPPKSVSSLKFKDGEVDDDVAPSVEFIGLKDNFKVSTNFRLGVEVSSPNDIDEVRIYMNGDRVTTDSSDPYGYNFELNSTGTFEFEAVAEDEDGREGSKKIKLQVSN